MVFLKREEKEKTRKKIGKNILTKKEEEREAERSDIL